MRPLELGVSINPTAADVAEHRAVAQRAAELGFELIGIQDHPYQSRFLDTFMLIATLLAETQRVRIFPDVANLPLRGPAMIAKQAASLDVLSGGRFELGLGAGSFWEGITAMGGPMRTPGESLEALEEAIRIIRLFWSGEASITFEGRFYSVKGLHPGPPPAHDIGVWIGGYKPKMLALSGRLADGWVPSVPYLPPEDVPAAQARVDAGAVQSGRDPGEIRRIYNVPGFITDDVVEPWLEQLVYFVTELRFDTIVFWPPQDPVRQVERFAEDVAPALREAYAKQ